jgi:UDP-3-O-[3-hydroxymyristoyl] glucosamine N-acyltransferase
LIVGVAPLATAVAGEISFYANPRYRRQLAATRASAVIAAAPVEGCEANWLLHPNPYLVFARVLAVFHPRPAPRAFVHPSAVIGEGCRFGEDVWIGACAVLGAGVELADRVRIMPGCVLEDGVRVGEESELQPLVVLRSGTRIGARVILGPGCVIGSDGYGFARDGRRHVKVPQVGGVVIEDDVELGAGVTVDRGTLGDTRIGRGTKVDDQVHLAHNVQVGEDCLLVAQVGISGSTRLGDGVVAGGQAGFAGHLEVCAGAMFGARAGVTRNVTAPGVYSGYPLREHRQWRREAAALGRLPELLRTVQRLERRVAELEARLAAGAREREEQ